jgi:8-oxo-dGTP pyrophosphatase MutT (NUDIX family)
MAGGKLARRPTYPRPACYLFRMKDLFVTKLREKLRAPLPGRAAQNKMAHGVRRSDAPPPADARQAGVLALFYPKAAEWHLVLIERSRSNANDRHSGQVSFPGGKYEEGDGTLAMTALREAEEEVGVKPQDIELLGHLTELYIPVSNFLVNPFVGITHQTPSFSPQQTEVQAIIEVPFELLCQPQTRQAADLRIGANITLRQVPCYQVFGKPVWGATAMILSELLEITACPPLPARPLATK